MIDVNKEGSTELSLPLRKGFPRCFPSGKVSPSLSCFNLHQLLRSSHNSCINNYFCVKTSVFDLTSLCQLRIKQMWMFQAEHCLVVTTNQLLNFIK